MNRKTWLALAVFIALLIGYGVGYQTGYNRAVGRTVVFASDSKDAPMSEAAKEKIESYFLAVIRLAEISIDELPGKK